ncbi:MAG TPA: nucleotidyltransferase domain-containing protein [Puia sp.]|nr:nucleotidyltransferase domain-containing protein [Puia sp.]
MTFERLIREPQHLLLKCISGSRAYNLSLPSSDTDIKGIFVLPRPELYGLTYTEQVSNATNDEVYFEVGRFMELLSKNNPNILELLSTPDKAVLYRHPLMELIRPEDFLSKLCLDTFAGYAKTQVKKARGLNKKMNQSFAKERKSVLEFCYVVKGNGTVALTEWLRENGFRQEDCGLVNLTHFRDAYLLYHQEQISSGEKLAGIISGGVANDVQLSSVSKGADPLVTMCFNKDAYSVYCREYGEYWTWVEERNTERYRNTVSHGKNYDAKNMMHTFRLLNMAEEIAVHHQVVVHREDREFLLRIRAGVYEYEELIGMVEEKMISIEEAYSRSCLPEAPDTQKAEELLVRIREGFYE